MKQSRVKITRRGKTYARAQAVIERLLCEIQLGIGNPQIVASAEWKILFGTKDSMVTNLQKLVATLANLPEDEVQKRNSKPLPQEEMSLSEDEMRLLAEWIAEGKEAASSV